MNPWLRIFKWLLKILFVLINRFCTWIVTEMDFIYDLYETNSVEEIKLASSKRDKIQLQPFLVYKRGRRKLQIFFIHLLQFSLIYIIARYKTVSTKTWQFLFWCCFAKKQTHSFIVQTYFVISSLFILHPIKTFYELISSPKNCM